MLDYISKYWPIVTVAGLAVVSVFNLGYFLPIGIHFIGVMDATNLIYSFGLVFGFFSVVGPLIGYILEKPFDFLGELEKLSRFGLGVLMGLFFVLGIFGLVAGYYFGFALMYFVVWTGTITAMMVTAELHAWKKSGIFHVYRYSLVLWAVTIFVLVLGSFVCSTELASQRFYDIITKERAFEHARIVRSSSNGLIIYSDERIFYVPMGEIKLISALDKLPFPFLERARRL